MGKDDKAREISLHRMLEKATVRIEILLGRARACDAGDRTPDGHTLSLFEGEGWIEEQRDLLLSTAIGAMRENAAADRKQQREPKAKRQLKRPRVRPSRGPR